MYNLLVSSNKEAWDLGAYEYDRSRFLEWTPDSITRKFTKLTAKNIEQLKSIPAVFAYEGTDELTRVGYLRRISERGRSVLVEFEFEDSIPGFPFSALKPVQLKLDIPNGEMYRTHWAVKDEDLFETLRSIGLVKSGLFAGDAAVGRVEEMRFKVALSFAGENRDFVAEVAEEIKKRLKTTISQ